MSQQSDLVLEYIDLVNRSGKELQEDLRIALASKNDFANHVNGLHNALTFIMENRQFRESMSSEEFNTYKAYLDSLMQDFFDKTWFPIVSKPVQDLEPEDIETAVIEIMEIMVKIQNKYIYFKYL